MSTVKKYWLFTLAGVFAASLYMGVRRIRCSVFYYGTAS